jgi:D-alanyl-D-alanine dipeptidase
LTSKCIIKAMRTHPTNPRRALLFLSFLALSMGMVSQVWGQYRHEGIGRPAARAGDLVDIKEVNSRIVVDLKYASEDNFAKQKLYEANVCFLRRSTALKLDAVQKELEALNLGLKVWDCYRPLAVQRSLWALLPDERYVADPRKGSRHNRGAAVDVTLVDSRGAELQMPTGFDEFSAPAHRRYQNLPEQVIRHRSLLETSMKKSGFVPLPEEWWHFDDETWSDYEVLDVPFRDLLKQ